VQAVYKCMNEKLCEILNQAKLTGEKEMAEEVWGCIIARNKRQIRIKMSALVLAILAMIGALIELAVSW
jgi:hypothetical protein